MTFDIKTHLPFLPVRQQNLEQRRIQQEAASREVGQGFASMHQRDIKNLCCMLNICTVRLSLPKFALCCPL